MPWLLPFSSFRSAFITLFAFHVMLPFPPFLEARNAPPTLVYVMSAKPYKTTSNLLFRLPEPPGGAS